VAIEIHGWAFHQSPEQRRADYAKALDLQLAGWTVIELTWQDLTTRPDSVIARVRAALEAGRRS
jgi:very-short-patch-repair endonuclease